MAPAQSSPAPPHFRILETSRITPPPGGAPPPTRSLPLTFFDVYWLAAPPVERLFFYPLAADADAARLPSALKSSLSETLLAFYPLAGRLRVTPGTANRYELFYEPGDGVAFTAAEYDADIGELGAHEPRTLSKLLPLVPRLQEENALLAVQATVLPRRGLVVGVAVHHSACDGAASTHFLHAWAANCAGAAAPPPPIIDRTLIGDPKGLYDIIYNELPSSDDFAFVKPADEMLLATFTLTREHLQVLKDAVAGELERRGAPPLRCSTVVATYGFTWSCYFQAKATTAGVSASAAGSKPTHFLFAVDHRARLQPPIPDKYLGNCLGPAFAVASEGDLVIGGAGSLCTACAAVAAAIDEAVGAGLRGAEGWMQRIKEVSAAGMPLTAAGSAKFRVYDVDFGFGKPAKVDIVSVAKTGAIAVAESREVVGGVEVGIALPPASMERFKKCFADGIRLLPRQHA